MLHYQPIAQYTAVNKVILVTVSIMAIILSYSDKFYLCVVILYILYSRPPPPPPIPPRETPVPFGGH